MVNGYKMVEATPMRQATTYRKKIIEESPIITWGKIEDTMFLGLEKSSKGFKVPATSKRDELAFKLGSQVQATKKKREAKELDKLQTTPSPSQ